MFQNLAIVALRSSRHNSYSPLPTLAALTLVSLTGLAALTFAPAVLAIIAIILATFAGCVFTATGMIGWALLTDASRTRSRIAREMLERLASVEEGIDRIYSLLVAASEDRVIVQELSDHFDGSSLPFALPMNENTYYYSDMVLESATRIAPEDYEVTEDTWDSVLPGYRGMWAQEELAGYSNDDRACGDRVATYSAGSEADEADDAAHRAEVATESRRDEWKNIMVRVKAEVDAIMAERAADFAPAPVVSEPCPLSVLADDGCPHHSMSWESGELVAWTSTMDYSDGTTTRCDRPAYAAAANSPVVPTVEEVAPLKVVAPVTPEGWDWANDAGLLAACKARGIKANARWKRATMIARLEAHEAK